ncbi:hypothetical protein LL06_08700 [Hoeflea sp. BAL378]|uniref:hypothetical protein n=1 Tax=Hoeflea sp. BAL378 TaxID=1547437 RepID=UPI0005132DF2|nr:hypothetical protein [Hoeflea sp. BAL378]KGF69764.1 hypothetical protein LL06_08700 [Hoeflea sp. BAL378]
MIAGILQMAITLLWSLWWREGGLIVMIMAVALSLSSAWISAVFVVLAIEDATLQQNSRSAAIAPARTALGNFSASLRTASSAMQTAARDAAALKLREDTVGGTCPGNTEAGEGPRQRMRDRHAQAMAGASTIADALAAEALDVDFALQRATKEELPEVFGRAVRLSMDPRISALRTTLTQVGIELSDGWVDNGNPYTCPTPQFQVVVDVALSALAITPLATDLPRAAAPSTADSSALLVESLKSLLRGEAPPSRPALLAIGIAVLVELLQIGLISRREGRLRKLGVVPDANESFWRAGRPRKHQRAMMLKLLAALDRYTYFDGKVLVYAMPQGGGEDARRPVAYFDLKLYNPTLRAFELGDIDPDWVAQRELQNVRFDLYKLPAHVDAWRRVATRDLAASVRSPIWG